MIKDICPVRWTGRQAVIALPEHVDVSNAGPIREELLSVINRGAQALIADLTATISCDDAGADALARAHHRAVISGTELRIAVTAQIVRRVLSLNGLDRLVAIYPTLKAATAARAPATVIPVAAIWPAGPAAIINPAVVRKLVDALQDGVALTGDDGTMAPTGSYTLTVIRDVTEARRLADLADLADAKVAAKQADRSQELLDSITNSLYNVGLSLSTAADLPHDAASQAIEEALRHLDDTVREIRDSAFTATRFRARTTASQRPNAQLDKAERPGRNAPGTAAAVMLI